MELTPEEEEMLAGKQGYPVQKAMEILVQLGEIYGAAKMIPVSNVHMPGSSVVVAGEAGTRLVEKMAEAKGAFKAFTTLNPAALDFSDWQEIGFSDATFNLQNRLTSAYHKMGAVPCHTCTPYLIGNCPRKGEHVAWGESSAIAFVNSVLGARTNREGGPSALAAALTGRVPAYGYHLEENRFGDVLVELITELHGVSDYGSLGYWVGKKIGDKVPVFTGIPVAVSLEELKSLSAALASSGSVALFHVVGVTPEAPSLEAAFGPRQPSTILKFGPAQMQESLSLLNKNQGQNVSFVAIGCPHASIRELEEISRLLIGKKISSEVDLWVTTSLAMKTLAERTGYAQIIEEAGGRIIIDTCPILAAMSEVLAMKAKGALATNSAKLAHYAPGQWRMPTYFGSLEQCLAAAMEGSFQ
ncbi:MAG TPA: aconitase X catalytic domain-containing protein [Desulfosporosinus sp.]|nr:aconitase X catalytic domain-containing protein [Desulfosporosinus sp.]